LTYQKFMISGVVIA